MAQTLVASSRELLGGSQPQKNTTRLSPKKAEKGEYMTG